MGHQACHETTGLKRLVLQGEPSSPPPPNIHNTANLPQQEDYRCLDELRLPLATLESILERVLEVSCQLCSSP